MLVWSCSTAGEVTNAILDFEAMIYLRSNLKIEKMSTVFSSEVVAILSFKLTFHVSAFAPPHLVVNMIGKKFDKLQNSDIMKIEGEYAVYKA
ncbi:hypothetical protein O9G_005882 [Rozella allomycis CSF55]|uniref:Uncharacterized protein n=1 Tax=Rozella allomycis (strain CSF55) TaxID=988480 RepID=A0A075B4V6_ROZAC|nr:hypothetical protein O9G_005882 [Rozella allomycis CSF55]|eukprot:EPZ36516.1 hypothetical protein O9G_005882 [Rozella allomycis CSF55]